LVKGGFLSATSVSWNPLEWKYSTDRSRPGGIDFLKQELLEVSQVPVPALPAALVEARRRGIDTQPLAEWASRLLDGRAIPEKQRGALENLRRQAIMPKRATGFKRPSPLEQQEERRLEIEALKFGLRDIDRKLAEHDAELARRQIEASQTSTVQGRIELARELKRKYPAQL